MSYVVSSVSPKVVKKHPISLETASVAVLVCEQATGITGTASESNEEDKPSAINGSFKLVRRQNLKGHGLGVVVFDVRLGCSVFEVAKWIPIQVSTIFQE